MAKVRTSPELLAYDPDRPCPKCGNDTVGTMWVSDFTHTCYAFPELGPQRDYDTHRGEHHHRSCLRCGYKWGEAVTSHSKDGA